jgi:ATP-dependent DNA helicase RecQ
LNSWDECKKIFNIESFRGQQEKIIQHTLDGQNSLVLMPTGGGKSLCYQAPIFISQKLGVIISPLISLMKDQVDKLRSIGLNAHYLNSSLEYAEKKVVMNDLVSGDCRYLYVAPETAVKPNFMNFLKKLDVGLLAIDESHCISKWGHQFRPEYQEIKQIINNLPNVPIMALTATAAIETRKDIITSLGIRDAKIFLNSFNRPNIYLECVQKENESNQLLSFVRENFNTQGRGIIYCLSRKRVEMFATFLNAKGFEAKPYHAGMANSRRDAVQHWFSSKPGRIVVATVAFGMGIDVADIRYVVHMDLPKTLESYYQEIGRAGRDGHASRSLMFYSRRDRALLMNMAAGGDGQVYHREIFGVNQLYGLAQSRNCRRKLLLLGFDEKWNSLSTNCCDNCDRDKDEHYVDCTEDALNFLNLVLKSPQGRTYKEWREYVLSKNLFSQLNLYFKTKGHGIEELIFQLMANGLLSISDFGKLTISADENDVESVKVFLRIKSHKVSAIKSSVKSKRPKENIYLSDDDNDGSLAEYDEDDLRLLLKEYRSKQSRKSRVPAYKVFSDKTIESIIDLRPSSESAFLDVYGFGEKKARKYASAILSI